MTKRGNRWMVAGLALAVLGAGMPLEAAAKKERPFLTATVNGKRFKVPGKRVQLTAGGGTIGFSALGVKGRKILYIACAVLFYGQPMPFTLSSPVCGTSYNETKGFRTKIWNDISVGGTSVTFESYDGTRVGGRFHAVVPGFSSPDLPTLTIDGEFHGPFEVGDPSR